MTTWLIFVRPVYKKRTLGRDGRTYHMVEVMQEGREYLSVKSDTKEGARMIGERATDHLRPCELTVISKASWDSASQQEKNRILGKPIPAPPKVRGGFRRKDHGGTHDWPNRPTREQPRD